MKQLNLFGKQAALSLPEDLLIYTQDVFNAPESKQLMHDLIAQTPWIQKEIIMYGKRMITPRLTAWYGDPSSFYSFSGSNFKPLPWIPSLILMKVRVEKLSSVIFNSVLLNYYRDGNDSVAWHSDDERELGDHPVIGSVSLGQTRQFDVRRKDVHARRYSINLESGSVLIMKGDLQRHWEHRIPKTNGFVGPRLNLTFRIIHDKV